MRFHFVTVPIHGSAEAELELNQFLAAHRIVALDRQLIADGPRSAWAICVTYVDATSAAGARSTSAPSVGGSPTDITHKGARVDYREVLPEAEFVVFAKLRDLRKQMAQRDGVPPYALFTNDQIAEMVRRSITSAVSPGM